MAYHGTTPQFILYEYYADGTAFESVGQDGTLMEFDTAEAAVEMALWMLEGGAESLVDGELPVVAVVAVLPDAEEVVGWVENLDGTAVYHFGDVDACERLWDALLGSARTS